MGRENKIKERLGLTKENYQGCLMSIVEYTDANNLVVEFNDNYRAKIKTAWKCFNTGRVKNPYYPHVMGVGYAGQKYPTSYPISGTNIKKGYMLPEYIIWSSILRRCFNKESVQKHPSYLEVTCCNEWLNYENFYEWIHSQSNYNFWKNDKSERWCVDKDIIKKGNKVYSPETCCLVPNNINVLFIKSDSTRGDMSIGVHYMKEDDLYVAYCSTEMGHQHLGSYKNSYNAFIAYKTFKEQRIKNIAIDSYSKGIITKECYEAMMKYEVEITD